MLLTFPMSDNNTQCILSVQKYSLDEWMIENYILNPGSSPIFHHKWHSLLTAQQVTNQFIITIKTSFFFIFVNSIIHF